MAERKVVRSRGDGSVYQDTARGGWVAALRVGILPSGRPQVRKRRAKTQAEAVRLLQELRKQEALGKKARSQAKTVASLLDEWLAHKVHEKRAPATVRWYTMLTNRHIKPLIGREPLSRLSRATVKRFFGDLRGVLEEETRGRAQVALARGTRAPKGGEATVAAVLRTLRAALNWAKECGEIDEVPIPKGIAGVYEYSEPIPPDPATLRRILARAKGTPVEGLVTLAVFTGGRISEILGLTWENVNIQSRSLQYVRQLSWTGKGKGNRVPVLTKPKTLSSKRPMHMVPPVADAIQDAWMRRSMYPQLIHDCDLNLVFLNADGRPFDRKNADYWLRKICKDLGIDDFGFHLLRHGNLTITATVTDPKTVSAIAGHSTTAMTMKRYIHPATSTMVEASEDVWEIIKGSEEKA